MMEPPSHELHPKSSRCCGWERLFSAVATIAVLGAELVADVQAQTHEDPSTRSSGKELYEAACAACHGSQGGGRSQDIVGFDIPLPDFTDCSFATREPDADWEAVIHDGGPARGFDHMMPAFGEALTLEEINQALSHVRSFCQEDAWPRGELNLPRPMVIEKAYPEDELVWTTGVATEGPGSVANELVYEKRFGARSQIELAVPIDFQQEGNAGDWTGGIGDIGVGVKHALFHRHRSGTIFSVAGEVILPTGNEDKGLGKGVTVFEPFVAFGQILPADSFLLFQGGLEIPTSSDGAEKEGFWRLALGKSFTQGGWGRTWSPMVEILAARELVSGREVLWDLVPQVQVTLNTRQHIMANVGVRFPMNETEGRPTTFLVYLLWDWFDGGFFEGW